MRPQLLNLSPLEQLRAGRLPRRLIQLFAGLTLYGVSTAFVIHGQLGPQPWTVLAEGLALHLPLSIGTIVIIVSGLVLLAWIPLRQWPGVGTVANALWIGVAIDLTLPRLPSDIDLLARVLFTVGGVFLNGVATALYIGSQLGPGPRDGLMTGLARVTGGSIRLVRTGLEIAVLAAGWLLGGIVGWGTLLYTLAIGPLAQFFLPLFTVELAGPAPARVVPPPPPTAPQTPGS